MAARRADPDDLDVLAALRPLLASAVFTALRGIHPVVTSQYRSTALYQCSYHTQ
jgi:hypothetical protein